MSGAALPCCHVCGTRVEYHRDYLDGHLLCEEHVTCRTCNLWQYAFAYGGYEEVIGHVVFTWSYTESAEDATHRRGEQKAATEEARRLARDPRAAPFELALENDPDDLTAWSVYADWLGENGYPLNERATRDRSRWADELSDLTAE